jgi:tetratricopeptide (TPR) repeat protein
MGIASWEHGFLGESIEYSLNLGDFKEVDQGFKELEEIRKRFSQSDRAMYFVNLIRANYLGIQGRHEEALSLLARCLEEEGDENIAAHVGISQIKSMIGAMLYQTGRYEEASEALEEAIDKEIPDPYVARVSDRALLSVIRLQQGRQKEAHQLLDQARSIAQAKKPSDIDDTLIQLAEARHAVIEERWQDACDGYQDLIEKTRIWKLKWHQAYFLLEWSKALQKTGDRAYINKSLELLREALSLFQEMKISKYQEECEKLMQIGLEEQQ